MLKLWSEPESCLLIKSQKGEEFELLREADKKEISIVKIIILTGLVLLLVLNFPEFINIIKNIYGIIFPLLLGAAIAYVLNILVAGYEKIYFPKSKKKIIIVSRRGVCVILSILTIILVLYFFLRILIPQFGQTIRLLSASFPVVYDKVIAWLNQHADQLPLLKQKLAEINMDGASVVKRGLGLLGNWAWGTVFLMGTVFGKIMNVVLAIIFSVYLLLGKDELKDKFAKLSKTYIRPARRQKLHIVMQTANEAFSNYIIGQCKDAVILGSLCTIGMLLFRFPYATVIGPVIGLTALIPMVGAYLGAAAGFLLIVMVDPLKAVLFIVFIIVLQQVEGNLIYPKVVGESIGLPGIWVFAALTIGGGLMGIAGILLGVPIAATFYKLLSKAVNERFKQT
jgi:predicted PurR-regulated permease PerM